MTPAELRTAFKDAAFDTAEPALWSDDEIRRYMNKAQTEFVKGIGGIRDATSAATELLFDAGVDTVKTSPKIMRILSARLPVSPWAISIVNCSHPLAQLPSQTGTQRMLVIGEEENMLRVIYTPVDPFSVRLVVTRLPLKDIVDDDSKLEIREEHHLDLVLGMLAQAFLKDDPDTYDRPRADKNAALFADAIAVAKQENALRNRVNSGMSYGGI